MEHRPNGPDVRSPFLPMVLLALTLLGWLGFQTWQLVRERTAIATAFANQDKSVEESKKLRDALDALARDTQRLADQGNANARLIVDELRKRGVTINPDAAPPAVPK